MKKFAFLPIASLLFISSFSSDHSVPDQIAVSPFRYDCAQVENAPFHLLEYTLDNDSKGLISLNDAAPKILT